MFSRQIKSAERKSMLRSTLVDGVGSATFDVFNLCKIKDKISSVDLICRIVKQCILVKQNTFLEKGKKEAEVPNK